MSCRLCDGAVDTVLELKPTPIANAFTDGPNEGGFYPLGLDQCTQCGHVQVSHVIPDDVLYGKSYTYMTPVEQTPEMMLRATSLKSRYPHVKKVLEIGANNGIFVRALKQRFADVVGCDPSSNGIADVLPYAFDSRVAGMVGEVDLVVANNVFAHIHDLRAVFSVIDEILRPEGVLVFEVQYFPDMVDRGVFDMIYHEHRDYHTVKPLQSFMERYGLYVHDVEHIPNHGGSIRVHCSRQQSRFVCVEEDIDFVGYREKINRSIKSIRSTTPKEVIAFGASAKACTLIHQCEIEGKFTYAVDSTRQKIGKYIPGTAIKIFDEDILSDTKSTTPLFLTAWNYADIIRRRYPDRKLIDPFNPVAQPIRLPEKEYQ